MSRTRFEQMPCPVARALEQIGDWWTLLIIRDAQLGKSRFAEFQQSLGIARNVLSDRLGKLVEHDIFTRERLHEPGVRHAYRLTDKGRELGTVLLALQLWSNRWVVDADQPSFVSTEHGSGRPVARLQPVDRDGQPIDPARLRLQPANRKLMESS